MAEDVLQIICAALGNIDPTQVTLQRDPQTGAMFAKVDLRWDQVETAMRENGRYVREAAKQTGIDIDVGLKSS
jgi:hypothetical protein